MIIEARIFNTRTKEMIYMPVLTPSSIAEWARIALEQGFTDKDPLMLKTPHDDVEGNPAYEGDVFECGVITQFGAVRERGIMVWRPDRNSFTMNITTPYGGDTSFDIVEPKKVGNIYENPELVQELQHEPNATTAAPSEGK